MAADELRLAFVPGATPGKWARIWRERYRTPLVLLPVDARDAERMIRTDAADIALVRLPVDRTGLSVIPLYEEKPVVVVSKDHMWAALDDHETVALSDIAAQTVISSPDEIWEERWTNPAHLADSTAQVVEWVATGMGVAVMPQSLARLHHRKDVTYRFISDGPTAPVALAWVAERTTPVVEDFIGVVRGRSINSSRGRAPAAADGRGGAAKKSGSANGRGAAGITDKGGAKPRGGSRSRGGSGSQGSSGSRGGAGAPRRPNRGGR